jgi:hypothetical protein
VVQGGETVIENLQTLCSACNQGKTNHHHVPPTEARDVVDHLKLNKSGHSPETGTMLAYLGIIILGILNENISLCRQRKMKAAPMLEISPNIHHRRVFKKIHFYMFGNTCDETPL